MRAWAAAPLWIAVSGCQLVFGYEDFSEGGTGHLSLPCDAGKAHAETGECVTVGATSCGYGFSPREFGECTPILPSVPCAPGDAALPGSSECESLAFLPCPSGKYPPQGSASDAVHVDATATGTPDGTESRPYETIGAALAATQGDVTLLVAAGTYDESLSIEGRVVDLAGACAARVELRSSQEGAVIRFGAGSTGSRIQGVRVTSGNPGIEISGADDVTVSEVVVSGTSGSGIEVNDVASVEPGTASATIERTLIENATGFGLAIFGAKVLVERSVIRGTRALGDGNRGDGIAAYSSPTLHWDSEGDPFRRVGGEVTVTRSVILENHEAGIFGQGATVKVTETLVDGTLPDVDGEGRGVWVEGTPASDVPSDLQIEASVIRGSSDVGIRIRNASAMVDGTTVTDSGASDACRGTGIRVRQDMDLPEPAPVTVRASTVARSHETGVLVEGGRVELYHVLIDDTRAEGCSGRFGDGIAAYPSAIGAGELTVQSTRIGNSARAGVAAFGPRVTLERVSLDCTTVYGDVAVQDSACGCEGVAEHCRSGGRALDSALLGLDGCAGDEARVCVEACFRQSLVSSSVLPGATVWIHGHDEISSRLSDELGCATLGGITPEAQFIVGAAKQTVVPGLGMINAVSQGLFKVRTDAVMVPNDQIPIGEVYFGPRDVRGSVLAHFRACGPGPSSGTACAGVVGATVELAGPPSTPVFFDASNAPDPTAESFVGSDVVFPHLAAGTFDVHVRAPEGVEGLDCRTVPGEYGWGIDGQPNTFRFRTEPGYATLAGVVDCEIRP